MRFHNITTDDMLNGDGLRTVLWVSGCSHHCKECHNPVTWDSESGLIFDAAAREELFSKLDKKHISGITFSGGDPLFVNNRNEITALAKEIRTRFPSKTIWLYTGYTWEQIEQLPVMEYIDVLVDGPFEIDKKNTQLHWRGSSNQRVIDVQMTRKNGQLILHCES